MNIDDIKRWLNNNVYIPLNNVDVKNNVYRIVLVMIIAYIVANLIGIFKIHINYTI
jgi:hypothetical protein